MTARLLFLFLFGFSMPVHARININYVVRVTNNSKAPLTVYCNNYALRPVLFTSPEQLKDVRLRDYNITPTPAEKQWLERDDLLSQMAQLQSRDVTANENPATDSVILALRKKLDLLETILRPVVKPGQTIDDIPCRLFNNDDRPTMGSYKNWNNAAAQEKEIRAWKMPATYFEVAGTKIELFDTNAKEDCPAGYIKVIARSAKKTSSVCIPDNNPNYRVHLIITPDGFELKSFTLFTLQ